jgi:hypothetical protein
MKGTLYILEAVIAVLMLISTLLLILQKSPQSLELSKANYKLDTYNVLSILESTSDLRKKILENNSTGISSDLSSYISINYDVAIFNKTTNLTATPTISSKDVITVSYFFSGDIGNYTSRELKVYLWGFE